MSLQSQTCSCWACQEYKTALYSGHFSRGLNSQQATLRDEVKSPSGTINKLAYCLLSEGWIPQCSSATTRSPEYAGIPWGPPRHVCGTWAARGTDADKRADAPAARSV